MSLKENGFDGLRRKPREESTVSEQVLLFQEFEDDVPWKEHWWGMPSFEMVDARPAYKIVVSFHNFQDVEKFASLLDLKVTKNTDSLWYPPERIDRPSDWVYDDEP